MAGKRGRKGGRYSRIDASIRALGGAAPPSGSDMERRERQRRGDSTLSAKKRTGYILKGKELEEIGIPIFPFNVEIPKAAPTTDLNKAKRYDIASVTAFSMKLLEQCCTSASIQDALGWQKPTEEVRKEIKSSPLYLPAILMPTYRVANDEGTPQQSKIYEDKEYRIYRQRTGTVPFGRMHISQGAAGDNTQELAEESRKDVLLKALAVTNANNYKCMTVGYDSEEFEVSADASLPWFDATNVGLQEEITFPAS